MVLESEEWPVISYEAGRSHSHDTTSKQHKVHQFYSASPLFEAMRERIEKWCEEDLFFKPLVVIDENVTFQEKERRERGRGKIFMLLRICDSFVKFLVL
jgi:hypothetical protein